MKKEFTGYFKLREPNHCYYPLHLDPYGSGCSHDCAYCFQKDQLYFRNEKDDKSRSRKPTAWRPNDPSITSIRKVDKLFNDVLGKQKTFNEVEIKHIKEKLLNNQKLSDTEKNIYSRFCVSQRLPLRIGGVVDPFQAIEKEAKITANILKILNNYNYPAQIFTKSNLVASEEYLKIIAEKKDNYYVQMTITTLDEKVAKALEPNAPVPLERLSALKKLNDLGICTSVRINPLYPEEFYQRIGESFERFIELIKQAGTNTVIVGGLRVMSKKQDYGPVATAEFINLALKDDNRFSNFDLKDILEKDGGTYYIPKDKLLKQYISIKEICANHNLKFTICYDANGNAEDNNFKKLWNCDKDCCNGYGNIPNFKTTFKEVLNRR